MTVDTTNSVIYVETTEDASYIDTYTIEITATAPTYVLDTLSYTITLNIV
jgi:hypothetical protein